MNDPAILIVDDRSSNLLALEAVLEPIGVPILRATSGEDALRQLMKHGDNIAVMLLDVQMPGLDGFETARLVRGRESLKHLPIIFITAVSREEAHIVKGYAQEAVDYIVKPFNPDVVRSKVRTLVESHRRALGLERTRLHGEQRLALVLEAAELGSWSWEASTGRVVCDDRCRALLGASRPKQLPLAAFGFDAAAAVRSDHPLRVEFRASSGRWLMSQARAHTDRWGAVWIFGVLSDISDDKQLQEERELFLGALGHDLRNPLQAIGMAAHLLKKHEDPTVTEPARVIASATGRMTSLINDLLDFVRSRAGDLPIEQGPADLSAICRDVIAEIELAHPRRRIELEVSGATNGSWDIGRLGQVVQNLITNALHHGDPSRSVHVRVEGKPRDVIIDVENAGEAISPEVQSRIFEPFVRGTSIRVGLGLYIVRQLVQAHLGRVEVTCLEGTTRFRVVLPRGSSTALPALAPSS